MPDEASFGHWLKQFRKSLDLTQAELARLVGCATVTIHKIEADGLRPSRQMAEQLAAALELPPAEVAFFLQAARAGASPTDQSRDGSAAPPSSAAPTVLAPLPHITALPRPATPLIGRKREVVEAVALLRQDEVRLLTLTGPGGTGKTRLGIEVAATLHGAFVDGVCFVALASIGDPALVVPTIAQALGVRESGDQPLVPMLQTVLRDRSLLLVLDNFEQVLDAAVEVAGLLQAAPAIKALVTSRAPLHLAAEQQYAVPPLTVPGGQGQDLVARVTQSEAGALFVARARAVKQDFALTPANAVAIADICRRLDGLPLAIELAAARVKILPPEALLQRLQSRLAVLTGGARDLPVRQQTLRNTIDWSYSLLEPDEQRLFARLAVFMRGCTLAAGEAVCHAQDERALDVVDGLQSLVEKGLLRQEEAASGEPRFVMLETIHEYARERLEASGEAEIIQQCHAHYYLALVEAAEAEMESGAEIAWLQRLAVEHDNLRQALAWSCMTPETTDLSLRLTGALYGFWFRHNHLTEARAWLERALAHPGGSPAARTKALFSLAQIADHAHEHARAMLLYEEVLASFQEADDQLGIARVLLNQGRTLYLESDYERARRLEEESLARFQELGDHAGVSMALISLGQVALAQGDWEQARARFEAARRLAYQVGLKGRAASATMFLGRIEHAAGDEAAASRLLAESLAHFHQGEDRRFAGAVVQGQAWTAHRQGDARWARRLYHESLALLREAGTNADRLECLVGFAAAIAATGELVHAARLFGAADALRAALAIALPPGSQAQYLRDLAAARADLGEPAWTAAWSEGGEMSLEQAVTYALEETGSA